MTAMFKASSLSSGDLLPGWTASEFNRYKEYMGDNWLPPADIGHNNPPPDRPRIPATWPISDPAPLPNVEDIRFAQQIEAIVDSDYSAIEKLILIKIRLRCDHDTLENAYASNATFMRAGSVKDPRTIREAVHHAIKGGHRT